MEQVLHAALGIQELEAPDSLSEIDRLAQEMARALESGVRLQSRALSKEDGSKLEQANQQIGEAVSYAAELNDTIDRVCGE